MPRRRKTISTPVAEEVLFRSDHTCCICRRRERDVQVHHIDGNNSNNSPENLAVVCLVCHSRVTAGRGLGRTFTPGAVRRYKRSWEQQVFESRRVHRPVVRYRKELLSQIDLIFCQILASRGDLSRAKELLGVLYELHLWRGNNLVDRQIIDGLHHLSVMSGLSSPRLAGLVAEKVWEMCWHFVGPDRVQMDKRDLGTVLESVDALGTLANFNCGFGHGHKATVAIAESLENFFEVGMWYSKRRIANAVIRSYEEGIEACYSDGEPVFSFGRAKLRRSLRRVRKMLSDEKREWRYQRSRIENLLST